MDPESILAKLGELQTQGADMMEFSKLEICQDPEFYQSLLFILNSQIPEISNTQKLLVISFMKEAKIHFHEQNDILEIIPLLDNNELKGLLSKLIVSCFDSLEGFIQFFEPIAQESPSKFLLVFTTFLESLPEDQNISVFIEKSTSILCSYLQHPEIELKLKIDSVKSIRSLTRSFKSPEILQEICLILFTTFMQIEICDETIPIFFECLQLRLLFESIDDMSFYTKLQELCMFLIEKGPPTNLEDSSFIYYVCHSLFRLFELHKDDFMAFLQIPLDNLIVILFLFSVYHSDTILKWEDDIESFYQDNEFHFSPFNSISTDEFYHDEEDASNSIYKEPYELQFFIYDELVKISSIQIDSTNNIGSLIISVCQSLIGSEHSNFSTEAINMSVITFFHKINIAIEFDVETFINTSNDIGKLYLLKYCCKNHIDVDDLSSQLEMLLTQESYISRFLVASVLLNASTDVVRPILYSNCFVSCIKYLSLFETENVSGIINVLGGLVDFVHKPATIIGFANQMSTILPSLLNHLRNFQHAYRATSALCGLIACFVQYPPFQSQLIPLTMSFIIDLCSTEKGGEIGLRLEKAILNCCSIETLSNDPNLANFNELFQKNLSLVPFPYIIENPSIVSTILGISDYFFRCGIVNDYDEFIFNLLNSDEIPYQYFDRIAPLCISLIKNESSAFRFQILQLLIEKSQLISNFEDQNELVLPTIGIIASIGIENPESLEPLITSLEYDFTVVMTSITKHLTVITRPLDIRLILALFFVFGDFQVFAENEEAKIPLKVINQKFAVAFFEKIIQVYSENRSVDLFYSAIFPKNDEICQHKLISCKLSELATLILTEQEMEEKKKDFSQFFLQENL